MGMFDKAKDLYSLQKKAKQLKSQLKDIHVEADHDGVTVVVNGEQKFLEVKIAEEAPKDPVKLGEAIVEASNRAIKKSQEIGAQKMQEVMGGLGGMFGQ